MMISKGVLSIGLVAMMSFVSCSDKKAEEPVTPAPAEQIPEVPAVPEAPAAVEAPTAAPDAAAAGKKAKGKAKKAAKKKPAAPAQ